MARRQDFLLKRFLSSERGADLLVWLVVCLPVALLDPQPQRTFGLTPLARDFIAFAALGFAVAMARRLPVVGAAVPTALTLALSPDLYYHNFLAAQVLLAFLLGRRTALIRTGLLFFAGACLAALVIVLVTPGTPMSAWPTACTTAVLAVVLPWLVGRYARQHDELIRSGFAVAERLERERDLAGERVRLRERARVAGDMHDSLGHELSLIALRAAAIEVDPAAGQPARHAAAELRAAAARATKRLRDVIGMLREDSDTAPVLPADETIAALVDRAQASGMRVDLSGDLPTLPPLADRAAYRVVQEALTNAAKHAPGVQVAVRLGTDAGSGDGMVTIANAIAGSARGSDGSGGYGAPVALLRPVDCRTASLLDANANARHARGRTSGVRVS